MHALLGEHLLTFPHLQLLMSLADLGQLYTHLSSGSWEAGEGGLCFLWNPAPSWVLGLARNCLWSKQPHGYSCVPGALTLKASSLGLPRDGWCGWVEKTSQFTLWGLQCYSLAHSRTEAAQPSGQCPGSEARVHGFQSQLRYHPSKRPLASDLIPRAPTSPSEKWGK